MVWTSQVHILKRDDLYAEVWTEPVERVASKYGLSGPGLLKICRGLRVPVPPRGWWAKKAAGQNVRQTPLPQAREGHPVQHRLCVRRNTLDSAPRSADALEAMAREQTPEARIEVAPELARPHPLVAKSMAALTKAGLKAKELLAKRRCLDIVVSREHVPRALRIMDALLKALEARGHTVEVTAPVLPPEARHVSRYDEVRPKPARTGVHIGQAFIEFRIEEIIEAIPPPNPAPPRSANAVERARWRLTQPRPTYGHRSTGRLVLRLTEYTFLNPPRQTWRDGRRGKVEDVLNDIVAGMVDLAERHRLWEEELQRLNEQRRSEELRRAEEERQRRLEERRVVDLDRRISAWRAAKDIDDLVQAVEDSGAQADDVSAWVEWARERAGRLRASAVEAAALVQPSC